MPYVDGFVLPVPTRKLAAYRKLAAKAGRIWMEYGALEFRECVGDDLHPKGVLPFTRMARAKKGETVMFSWIVFKSRAHRDAVNKKVMKDPRMADPPSSMPFDPKRMAYGGFKVLVDAGGSSRRR